MKHRDAVAIVLDVRQAGTEPSGTERAAIEHVAACSDCWNDIRRVHVALTNTLPADDARMHALYGCAEVQGRLFALIDVAPEALSRDHPTVARHVAWCVPCRERLADLHSFGATLTALGASMETAPTARPWLERVGLLVVRLRRALASFESVPEWMSALPSLVAEPVRGAPTPDAAAGRSICIEVDWPFSPSELRARLSIRPQHPNRLRLTVSVRGDDAFEGMLRLQEKSEEGTRLVAAASARCPCSIDLEDIPVGSYLLELRDHDDRVVATTDLDVRADDEP